MPTFDRFAQAARNALGEVLCCPADDAAFSALDAKGPAFDFYVDTDADSLDMLDITFSIEKELGVKINIQSLLNSDEPMTVQNLYDSMRE